MLRSYKINGMLVTQGLKQTEMMQQQIVLLEKCIQINLLLCALDGMTEGTEETKETFET